jgi:hypothetical protein
VTAAPTPINRNHYELLVKLCLRIEDLERAEVLSVRDVIVEDVARWWEAEKDVAYSVAQDELSKADEDSQRQELLRRLNDRERRLLGISE